MKIKFKKLEEEAKIPTRATDGSGAYDITCTHTVYHRKKTSSSGYVHYVECKTGLAMQVPEGYVGLLFARSSVSNKGLSLCNGVGVIDSDYRGEVTARFYEMNTKVASAYNKGERCIQLLVVPALDLDFEQVEQLDSTERGEGGYGSTGR